MSVVGDRSTPGGTAQVVARRRQRTVVLCYHAVSARWPGPLAVTPEDLERQVRLLLSRGWVPATFSRAVLQPPAARTFAVTFDDAFLSVLRLGLPVLSAMSVPATVFAPTDFMDRRQPLFWDGIDHWQMTEHANELQSMDWTDLGELSAHGWEIGSHTRSHPHLTELDDRALDEQLVESRLACERELGQPCRTLAYPYGEADLRVARRAEAAGYEAAAILRPGFVPAPIHPFLYPRVGVYRIDSAWRFRLKLSRIREVLRPAPVRPTW